MRPFNLIVLLGVLFLLGCNSYFYWPEKTPPVPEYSRDPNINIRYFKAVDGTVLQGWAIPTHSRPSKGLVVFCHGADSHIGEYYDAVKFIHENGYDLFMFDYRGYGGSQGSPNRNGTIADTNAAIDFAKQDPLIRNNKLALFGFSLGASISIVTAANRSDVLGVISEGGFTSYREIGKKVVSDRWTTWPLALLAPILVSRGMDPIDFVDKISPRPLFLVHGREDELVPYSMSERLYVQAREPKSLWIMQGMKHFNKPGERHPDYEHRILGYLDYIFLSFEGKATQAPPDCRPGSKLYF